PAVVAPWLGAFAAGKCQRAETADGPPPPPPPQHRRTLRSSRLVPPGQTNSSGRPPDAARMRGRGGPAPHQPSLPLSGMPWKARRFRLCRLMREPRSSTSKRAARASTLSTEVDAERDAAGDRAVEGDSRPEGGSARCWNSCAVETASSLARLSMPRVQSMEGLVGPSHPFQSVELPEIIEEYLDHGTALCMAFNRRGTLLASGTKEGQVVIWDFDTRGVAAVLSGHEGPVTALSWSRNGRHLLSGSEDQSVILWSVLDGSQLCRALRATPTAAGGIPEGFLSRDSESDTDGVAHAPAVAAPAGGRTAQAVPLQRQPQRPQAVGQLRTIPEGMLSHESATGSDSESGSSSSSSSEGKGDTAVGKAPAARAVLPLHAVPEGLLSREDDGGKSTPPPQPRAVPEGWLSYEED
ncbi:WD repeat domain-containing protein, partial [Tetrabaena socialis]